MTFRGLRLLSPLSPRHAWGHPFIFTLCLLRAQGLGNTQTSVFLVVWAAHFDPVYERVTSRQAGPLESMTTNPSQGFPAFPTHLSFSITCFRLQGHTPLTWSVLLASKKKINITNQGCSLFLVSPTPILHLQSVHSSTAAFLACPPFYCSSC